MSLGSGSAVIAVPLFQPGPSGPWRLGGNEASLPGPRRRGLALRLAIVFLMVGGVMLARARGTSESDALAPRVSFEADPVKATAHLREAIRIRTISAGDPAAFAAFHAFLQREYPLTHRALSRETVGGSSLVYRWPGRDPRTAPILLMGHMDVVPIAPGTEASWRTPPFEAAVEGDWLYGRGAIDDKPGIIAIMEAVEALLSSGFAPDRTVILQFGHDEETGGERGAKAIVEKLSAEGVRPALVLDEGAALVSGRAIGAGPLVAAVGVAEKGAVSLTLSVRGSGGHASTPPPLTHIGRLARAISVLEANPFPARLDGVPEAMLERALPYLPLGHRLVLGNLWLTRPLVTRRLLAKPLTAAMLRTTLAPTVFTAGDRDNVLPSLATAVLNLRIRPGETVTSVTGRVRTLIADPEISISQLGPSWDPAPASSIDGDAFRLIRTTIQETLGEAPPPVLPFLVMGRTDALYWARRSVPTYRFSPFPMEDDVAQRAHGTNERISIQGFVRGIGFYARLIRSAQSASLPPPS
ncbi:MAG: M20/M25/M40 family metallo-hydrolase [Vicinamibacteria bacterium]|nr:M20/M25/M40 family metallo-hydrolase [Vicinamibacteria bacterium]